MGKLPAFSIQRYVIGRLPILLLHHVHCCTYKFQRNVFKTYRYTLVSVRVAKRGNWVYFPEPESWLDAADVCAAGGGSLVSIKNARENQEFVHFVATVNDEETYVWIGGNDLDAEVSAVSSRTFWYRCHRKEPRAASWIPVVYCRFE